MKQTIQTGLAAIRAYSRNLTNRKNEAETPFLAAMIQPDDICLHIGATDGRHSYAMAQVLKKGSGHIYAFEPSIITYPVLKIVLRMHRLGETVSPARLAFSDSPGMAVLNVPVKKSGRYGNAFGFLSEKSTGRSDVNLSDVISFEVETTTIDHIVDTQTKRVDFIRMDIEGSEQAALSGGWATIKKNKPHLLIEIHPTLLKEQFGGDPNKIYQDFKALSYAIYHLDENNQLVESGDMDIAPWKDCFLIHPDRPHSLPI